MRLRTFEVSDFSKLDSLPVELFQRVLPHLPLGQCADVCVSDSGILDVLSRDRTPQGVALRKAVMANVGAGVSSSMYGGALISMVPRRLASVSRTTLQRLGGGRAPVLDVVTAELREPVLALITTLTPLLGGGCGDDPVRQALEAGTLPEAWCDVAFRRGIRRMGHLVGAERAFLAANPGLTAAQQRISRQALNALNLHECALPDVVADPGCDGPSDLIAKVTPLVAAAAHMMGKVRWARFGLGTSFLDGLCGRIVPTAALASRPVSKTLLEVHGGGASIPARRSGDDHQLAPLSLPDMRIVARPNSIQISRRLQPWLGFEEAEDDASGEAGPARPGRWRIVCEWHVGAKQSYAPTPTSATYTHEADEAFAFLWLLERRPLDVLRSLPEGTTVSALLWKAALEKPAAPEAAAPEPAPPVAATPPRMCSRAFLDSCGLVRGILDASAEDILLVDGTDSEAAALDALAHAEPAVTTDDLLLLQALAAVPWPSSTPSALDAMLCTLPSPCPLVRLLNVADQVAHGGCVERCVALLIELLSR